MLEKADHIDDGVALVGHHDEGYRQQINCSPVDAQAKLVQQILAQHVYHLEGAETSNWIQGHSTNFWIIDCKQLCVYRCSDQTFQPSVTAVLGGGKEMSGSLSAKYVPRICNSHLAVMP
jgi:hypothetical protein